VPAVQQGDRVAPLGRTEEPPADGHGDIQPRPAVNGMNQAIGPTSWLDPTARHAAATASRGLAASTDPRPTRRTVEPFERGA
jgi:hypothetical protein